MIRGWNTNRRRSLFGPALIISTSLFCLSSRVEATCLEGFGEIDLVPNVIWTFKDSVAACPAGDSLVFGSNPHKPSQLRVVISYFDSNCDPKVGVPPESIYVVASTHSGNAKANNQPKIYADSATDGSGQTRVTIRSLSGGGKIKIRIFVSGVEAGGYSTPTVRTIDTNADGRVTSADVTGYLDVNYDGVSDVVDLGRIQASQGHWHRNALLGTPVARTSFPEAYDYGEGYLAWEPNGRSVVYGGHHGCADDCVLDTVSVSGTTPPSQFTFPGCREDYDPAWSPRGHEIIFSRSGSSIFRKGIVVPDTLEMLVAYVPDSTVSRYSDSDVSPNGRKVAFVDINTSNSNANIYTVGINGDSLTQITSLSANPIRWPRWSADGQYIYFSAEINTSDFAIYKVPFIGGTVTQVDTSIGRQEKYPNNSPDGAVLVVGHEGVTGSLVYAATLDPTLENPDLIRNYEAHPSSYAMFPAFSPDGTRLAFVGKPSLGTSDGNEQVLITRRNMSLPPALSAIGDKVVEVHDELAFTISASDPESDALTYEAFYLEAGMSFSPSTRQFSWEPGDGAVNRSFWVVFRVATPSGGVDREVVKISVIEDGLRTADLASSPGGAILADAVEGGVFSIRATGAKDQRATLVIYSVNGRLLKALDGPGNSRLTWDGRDLNGRSVATGIYLYKVVVGTARTQGKVLLVR